MTKNFTHEFVTTIPGSLEAGVVYISIEYATVVHRCACGCGSKIVTPLAPEDWHLIFDGKTVSLNPSIGNWSYPCRSHYWIRNDKVIWAESWTDEEVERSRKWGKKKRSWFFDFWGSGDDK